MEHGFELSKHLAPQRKDGGEILRVAGSKYLANSEAKVGKASCEQGKIHQTMSTKKEEKWNKVFSTLKDSFLMLPTLVKFGPKKGCIYGGEWAGGNWVGPFSPPPCHCGVPRNFPHFSGPVIPRSAREWRSFLRIFGENWKKTGKRG